MQVYRFPFSLHLPNMIRTVPAYRFSTEHQRTTQDKGSSFSQTNLNALEVLFHLPRGRKVAEHEVKHKVSDDRRLVLEVVEETETLAGEVPANDGHRQVGAVLSAEFLGQGETQVSALVGNLVHLAQEHVPFLAGQAAVFKVGTGPFAAVVKEPVVVVGHLERGNLFIDELVQLAQVVLNILRDGEQVRSPG